MKVRMLTGISGADFNLVPKDESDRFSDGEAVRLMLSDQAEPADDEAEAALAAARSASEPEPNPKPEPAPEPPVIAPTPNPLDHDGDGRKGGMKGVPARRTKKA
jgi:hypothetical protein